MYILSPRSFHKSGKYGHSLFTTLSKSWLFWSDGHETYDYSKSYTEFYGNSTDRQTGGWTWFSVWDVLLFIRRRVRKKRRSFCRFECFIPSGDRSSKYTRSYSWSQLLIGHQSLYFLHFPGMVRANTVYFKWRPLTVLDITWRYKTPVNFLYSSLPSWISSAQFLCVRRRARD